MHTVSIHSRRTNLSLAWGALICLSIVLGLAISFTPLVLIGVVVVLSAVFWMRIARWPSIPSLIVIVLLLIPMVGLFVGHSKDYKTDVETVSESIESGSLGNRIVFPMLFVLGLYFVQLRPVDALRSNVTPWAGIYLAFLCLSVFWSLETMLTLRRVIVPVCVFAFVYGIGAVYYGTMRNGYVPMVRAIVWTSSTAALVILATRILQGDVQVMEPTWRLGNESVENQTAWMFGLGLLVAWATWARMDIWPIYQEKVFHLSILILTLLMTKSRTTLIAVFLGVLTIEWLRPRLGWRRLMRVSGMVAVCLVLVFVPGFDATWTRGNEEAIDTLSGRLPLWENLLQIISGHLWGGLGYGALWSPKIVQAFSSHWTPTATHNGYLELVADLGLVGLLLSFVITGLSVWNGLKLTRYPEYREIGIALVALIVASLVVSMGMSWYLERFQEYPSIVVLGLSVYVAHCLTALQQKVNTPGSGVTAPQTYRKEAIS